MSGPPRTAKLVEIAELNPRLAESLDSEEMVSFVPMSAVTSESASTSTGEDRPIRCDSLRDVLSKVASAEPGRSELPRRMSRSARRAATKG